MRWKMATVLIMTIYCKMFGEEGIGGIAENKVE